MDNVVIPDGFWDPFITYGVNYISVLDLINLRIACKQCYERIGNEFLKHKLLKVVKNRLKLIFDDVTDEFIKFLETTNSYISGSFILACITEEFIPNDLDIYIDEDLLTYYLPRTLKKKSITRVSLHSKPKIFDEKFGMNFITNTFADDDNEYMFSSYYYYKDNYKINFISVKNEDLRGNNTIDGIIKQTFDFNICKNWMYVRNGKLYLDILDLKAIRNKEITINLEILPKKLNIAPKNTENEEWVKGDSYQYIDSKRLVKYSKRGYKFINIAIYLCNNMIIHEKINSPLDINQYYVFYTLNTDIPRSIFTNSVSYKTNFCESSKCIDKVKHQIRDDSPFCNGFGIKYTDGFNVSRLMRRYIIPPHHLIIFAKYLFICEDKTLELNNNIKYNHSFGDNHNFFTDSINSQILDKYSIKKKGGILSSFKTFSIDLNLENSLHTCKYDETNCITKKLFGEIPHVLHSYEKQVITKVFEMYTRETVVFLLKEKNHTKIKNLDICVTKNNITLKRKRPSDNDSLEKSNATKKSKVILLE